MPRAGSLARIVGAIAAAGVLIVLLSAVHLLPQLCSPFAETTTVRSQPVILKSITNLSRYEAASGSFEVVVDLTTRTSLLPSFLAGSETLFAGPGHRYRLRRLFPAQEPGDHGEREPHLGDRRAAHLR